MADPENKEIFQIKEKLTKRKKNPRSWTMKKKIMKS